jgi:serine/threonine protein kinase
MKVILDDQKGKSKALYHFQSLSKNIPQMLQLYFKDRKQKQPLSKDLQSLIAGMLSFDPDKRPTIFQVKQHPWFKDFPWHQLAAKEILPPKGCYDDSLVVEENSNDPWKDW